MESKVLVGDLIGRQTIDEELKKLDLSREILSGDIRFEGMVFEFAKRFKGARKNLTICHACVSRKSTFRDARWVTTYICLQVYRIEARWALSLLILHIYFSSYLLPGFGFLLFPETELPGLVFPAVIFLPTDWAFIFLALSNLSPKAFAAGGLALAE